MSIILEYFDVLFKWKNGVPLIELKLKESKKINKVVPVYIKNGMPLSSSDLRYFTHYLGNEKDKEVYNERKKLFPKTKLIEWYIDTFNPIDTDKLIEYSNSIGKKVSNSLQKFYSTESDELQRTKEKYKIRSAMWSAKIGKLNSKKWEDKNWVSRIMSSSKKQKAYEKVSIIMKEKWKDKDFYEKMIKIANNPDRIEKISKASVKMWNYVKQHDLEKYYKMLHSCKNKNFELNNVKLNSIEYTIATILNKLNLEWKFEVPFIFGESAYLPDFYIERHKLIIECYGDFWHANPKMFNSTDTTHKSRTAVDVWKYDLEKKQCFEKNGYKYLNFWESDILENIELIKENIQNEIC